MNGYIAHSDRIMEAVVKRDLRHTRNGGWRLVPPRDAMEPGLDPDLPMPVGVSEVGLTTNKRDKLPDSAFVFPEDRSYPIPDEGHAKAALARGKSNLSADDYEHLKRAVRRRFPRMNVK